MSTLSNYNPSLIINRKKKKPSTIMLAPSPDSFMPGSFFNCENWWEEAKKTGRVKLIPETTPAEFKKEVLAEIELLKVKLRPYQLMRLNFKKFNHKAQHWCFLGLLTGDSFSHEARVLLQKKYETISKLQYLLMMSSTRKYGFISFKNQDMEPGSRLTALEKFFFMSYKPTHKKIFDYIKGETETLSI